MRALQCCLAYVAALVVGVATCACFLRHPPDCEPFYAGLVITTASTLVVWLFSIANDNSSIYDPYWGWRRRSSRSG